MSSTAPPTSANAATPLDGSISGTDTPAQETVAVPRIMAVAATTAGISVLAKFLIARSPGKSPYCCVALTRERE
jgi:hypothetical protein